MLNPMAIYSVDVMVMSQKFNCILPTEIKYMKFTTHLKFYSIILDFISRNFSSKTSVTFSQYWGWSGGAKVLGKLPVPGRPTHLDYSRARAYCACSRCGCGVFRHFFSHLSLLFSFSLSLGDGPI